MFLRPLFILSPVRVFSEEFRGYGRFTNGSVRCGVVHAPSAARRRKFNGTTAAFRVSARNQISRLMDFQRLIRSAESKFERMARDSAAGPW